MADARCSRAKHSRYKRMQKRRYRGYNDSKRGGQISRYRSYHSFYLHEDCTSAHPRAESFQFSIEIKFLLGPIPVETYGGGEKGRVSKMDKKSFDVDSLTTIFHGSCFPDAPRDTKMDKTLKNRIEILRPKFPPVV